MAPRRTRSQDPRTDDQPHEESLIFNPLGKEDIQLVNYVKEMTKEYEDLQDHDLWNAYKEDFQFWNISYLSKVPVRNLVKFRKVLRQNGVYCDIRLPPADAIAMSLRHPNGPEWKENDVKELISYIGNNATPRIKRHFPHLFTELEKTVKRDQSAPANPSPEMTEEKRTTTAIVQLSKIFPDDMKYSGYDDSFEWKYQIFQDYCVRVGLPVTDNALRLAFSTMLKGQALSTYYTQRHYWESNSIPAFMGIKNYFEGEEHQRAKQAEWSTITLQKIVEDNGGKTIKECLELLLEKLEKLFHSLPANIKNDTTYRLKLIESTRLHPACEWATAKPSSTIPGLIQDLRSNVCQYHDKDRASNKDTNTFYTDRRYYGQTRRYQQQHSGRSQNQRYNDHRENSHDHNHDSCNDPGHRCKYCYVCGKCGCHSTKHTPQERERAKKRFRERMEKRTAQFFEEQDGVEPDKNDDSLTDKITDMMLNDEAKETKDPQEPSSRGLPTDVFMAPGEPPEIGTTITQELTRRAAEHYISATLEPAESDDMIGQMISPTLEVKDPANQELLIPTQSGELQTAYTSSSRYSENAFQGLLFDTGAADFSTAGYRQFLAYQRIDKTAALDASTAGAANIRFGAGEPLRSIGSYDMKTPIGNILFHIINAPTPFLVSLKDLDRLKVYFDNTRDVIVGPKPNQTTPVIRRFGHPFLVWGTSCGTYLIESFAENPCFLTEVELRRIHRRFGHPSTEKLRRVLERAGHDVDRAAAEQIRKVCEYCQKHGKSPGRFKFSLHEDVDFNHTVIIDIMYIDNKPLLHAVDEATRFHAANWLTNLTTEHVWDTLRHMWIDMYLGPPDFIMTDAGTNFTSKKFSHLAGNVGTTVRTVPVEAHWSIGVVERYHGIIRRIYYIIRDELPSLTPQMMLQTAVKAMNDTAGPDGLVPTLLVFGAYPRLVEYDPPAPSISQRAATLKKAIAEVRQLYAQRQVNDALNTRNGPSTASILDLPINSEVLVWREGKGGQTGKWTGPYRLESTDGETCTVSVSGKSTDFRSTVVKPFYREDVREDTEISESLNRDNSNIPPPPSVVIPKKTVTTYVQYEASRKKELDGLLERGVFEIVDKDDVPQGIRIFNTRFVDEVKNAGTPDAFEKSRLVVQAYNDDGKKLVLTQSPTLQRSSHRCLLFTTVQLLQEGCQLYLRDVTQAYVQSTTTLNREFYVRPPTELSKDLPDGSLLRVRKPLYGIPEAGNHWFQTYYKHHEEQLGMKPSPYDPCLLHCNKPEFGYGVVGLQTDDTLILANKSFAEREEKKIHDASFTCKPRQIMTPSTSLKFNGAIISEDGQGITLTQERTLKLIKLIKNHNADSVSSRGKVRRNMTPKEQYISQRALGAYVATMSQPEAAFDLSFAAQMTDPGKADIDLLNKRLQWQSENTTRGLRFVKVDMETAKLMVFADASFAGNRDLSSQMGYVIVIVDTGNNANVLHWSSTKCKRVTRSVLAAELYALVNAFDSASVIRDTLTQILRLKKQLPLVVCTDSKSLYDCLVKLGSTQEKRLMIDLMCLRQAFERKEINEVKWIDGSTNPADAMTKAKPCAALKNLIDMNKLQLRVEGWTEHTTTF
jgi:hypothetical protein